MPDRGQEVEEEEPAELERGQEPEEEERAEQEPAQGPEAGELAEQDGGQEPEEGSERGEFDLEQDGAMAGWEHGLVQILRRIRVQDLDPELNVQLVSGPEGRIQVRLLLIEEDSDELLRTIAANCPSAAEAA